MSRQRLAVSLFAGTLIGAFVLDVLAVFDLDGILHSVNLDVVHPGDPLSLVTAAAMLVCVLATVNRTNTAPYLAVAVLLTSSAVLSLVEQQPTGVGSIPLMTTELAACFLLLVKCLWQLDSSARSWGAVAVLVAGVLGTVLWRFGAGAPQVLTDMSGNLLLMMLQAAIVVGAGIMAGYALRRRVPA